MTGNTEVLKSFHTYKKQGVDYKISEERKDMADNRKMQQAKAAKNDEFYTEYRTISDEMGHYRTQFESTATSVH